MSEKLMQEGRFIMIIGLLLVLIGTGGCHFSCKSICPDCENQQEREG